MGTVYNKNGGGSSVKLIDLGVGTSFNVSNYSGYQKFTKDNFICDAQYVSCSNSNLIYSKEGTSSRASVSGSCSFTKSYNAQTGVLTAYSSISAASGGWPVNGSVPSPSATGNVHAYLILGRLK